jgi:hypothetical protein
MARESGIQFPVLLSWWSGNNTPITCVGTLVKMGDLCVECKKRKIETLKDWRTGYKYIASKGSKNYGLCSACRKKRIKGESHGSKNKN